MEKTLDEKIEDLKKDHQDALQGKIDSLTLKYAVEEALPDVGIPWKKYLGSKLWGTIGRVHIEHDFYDWTKEKKQPTLETIILASKSLVPVGMTKCKDSCLSFRPTSFVESMPEEKKERWEEEIEVSPFIVHYDIFQEPKFTVKWFSELKGIGIVDVSITIRLERELGHLYPVYDTTPAGNQSRNILKMVFLPPRESITIFNEDKDPLGDRQPHLKWYSGNDVPNKHTLYWLDTYLDKSPTIENLLTPFLTKKDK